MPDSLPRSGTEGVSIGIEIYKPELGGAVEELQRKYIAPSPVVCCAAYRDAASVASACQSKVDEVNLLSQPEVKRPELIPRML